MTALTVGSLFSGIGGLELGLERAGMRTVWQVERDDYCRRVLAKHWPDVARFEDVRDVGAHNLPPVDVICGGFPCQDVSTAGKRAGIQEGTRSGLWIEYARIVGELRPRYVVVENVPGLLADGMGRVLGDLAALGYDAVWHCVSAAAVGAPHIRDRVFVLGHAHGTPTHALAAASAPRNAARQPGRRSAALADADRTARRSEARDAVARDGGSSLRERAAESGRRGAAIPDAVRARLEGHRDRALGASAEHAAACDTRGWAVEPDVGRVAHGVPARVDRLRALGNAVVPQVAEFIGRLIVAADAESRGECAA